MSLNLEEVSLHAHLSDPKPVTSPESKPVGDETVVDGTNPLSLEEMSELEESNYHWKLKRYHEAAHAVVAHLLGFRPMYIDNDVTQLDRRVLKFVHTANFVFRTREARVRAGEYAVMYIAGPAAEAKIRGESLVDLRAESNIIIDEGCVGDYWRVNQLLVRVMCHSALEFSNEVRDHQLLLWEAKAIAILNNDSVWAAVESVADELELQLGTLGRDELLAAIERGLSSR